MEKGFLITLPRHDEVTEYLAVFSKPLIEKASKMFIKFKKLEDSNVTKEKFESLLKKINYKMLIFNGHGSHDSITGHKENVLVKSGMNDNLLKERITYARSCWAAADLGIKSMKGNKNGCFIGYKIPFMFLSDITWETNPIKDNVAKIFFETSNKVPLAFFKGHSAEEAHKTSKKSMLKSINKLLKEGNKDSQVIAETLWNNYVGQELLGNPETIF